MSMYGKYPKVKNLNGDWVEQNGIDGAPHAWPTTDCSKDKRLTVQSSREEVDINNIAKKMKLGYQPDISQGGRFEDISEFDGLEEAQIKVMEANEMFMELPAEIRFRFENKPENLIKFLEDDSNRKEAEKMGLIDPRIDEIVPNDSGVTPAPAH